MSLPGDNVRHFAVWIGAAPGVSALAERRPVREERDRRPANVASASSKDTTSTSSAADELSSLPALITAPLDPVRLGAANRALERAGIPVAVRCATDRRADGARRRIRRSEHVRARYDLVAQTGAVGRNARRRRSRRVDRGRAAIRYRWVAALARRDELSGARDRSSRGSAPCSPSDSLASRVQ